MISIRSLGACLVLLTAASCASTERETATSSRGPRTEYSPPKGRGERVGGATVLNTVRTTHIFSDPKNPDTFVLELRGPRVLSSRLHLSVLSSKGDTLHREVLPTSVLLTDPTLKDNLSASVREREISVLRGMNTFFGDSHFVQPAVPAVATPPAGLDAQAWASLRRDPAAVGFHYPGSKGETRLIYARQLGRVVVLAE
ncbi:hypothetical protein A8B98_20040 [Hymenobacter sp. UV11]|nr:hypothetical protein A8B98_20040 [Hymenobacter sp. UV11]